MRLFIILCLAMGLAAAAEAFDPGSSTSSLAQPLASPGNQRTYRAAIIRGLTVPTGTHEVLIQANGVVFPLGKTRGRVYIVVDQYEWDSSVPSMAYEVSDSNVAEFDWRQSSLAARMTFELLAPVTLTEGQHSVMLMVEQDLGLTPVVMEQGAALTILIDPATTVVSAISQGPEPGTTLTAATWQAECQGLTLACPDAGSPLTPDGAWLDFCTTNTSFLPLPAGHPSCSTLEVAFTGGGQTIALAAYGVECEGCGEAGRGTAGQPAGIIGVDSSIRYTRTDESYALQTLSSSTAAAAPMWAQWVDDSLGTGAHVAHLWSQEARWDPSLEGDNRVLYRVQEKAVLVAMQGFAVFGHASQDAAPGVYHQTSNVCGVRTADAGDLGGDVAVCSSSVMRAACPTSGASPTPDCASGTLCQKVIATGTMTIPSGHSGDVMVRGRTQAVGSACDYGGRAVVTLRVGGQVVGTRAEQHFAYPEHAFGDGSRPLAVHAYLEGLSAGTHTVELLAGGIPEKASGCFGAPSERAGTFLGTAFDTGGSLVWWG